MKKLLLTLGTISGMGAAVGSVAVLSSCKEDAKLTDAQIESIKSHLYATTVSADEVAGQEDPAESDAWLAPDGTSAAGGIFGDSVVNTGDEAHEGEDKIIIKDADLPQGVKWEHTVLENGNVEFSKTIAAKSNGVYGAKTLILVFDGDAKLVSAEVVRGPKGDNPTKVVKSDATKKDNFNKKHPKALEAIKNKGKK